MNVDFASVATIPLPVGMDAVVLLPETAEAIIMRPNPPRRRFSDEDFAEICAQYPDLRVEMNSEGEIMIMLPVISDGGRRNFLLTSRLGIWVEADGTGVGFDSSTGFTLPNGAKRSPDASWIRSERWNALTDAQKDEFAPICPDFVVELRSKSDRLKTLQNKMEEYLANGAQLGWLIDPIEKRVHIYRPGREAEILEDPKEVFGESLLQGFTLKLKSILD